MSNQQCLIQSKYHTKRRKFANKNLLWELSYVNHKKTFNNIKYQTDTELSNEHWNIISANKTLSISWEILGTHKSYNQSSKRCLLCRNEKLAIALHEDDNMLNKRSEVISRCMHRNKYMLANYDKKVQMTSYSVMLYHCIVDFNVNCSFKKELNTSTYPIYLFPFRRFECTTLTFKSFTFHFY